jgi:hypothetical protein
VIPILQFAHEAAKDREGRLYRCHLSDHQQKATYLTESVLNNSMVIPDHPFGKIT